MTAEPTLRPVPLTRFTLPPGLEATQAPEERGLARDQVRLVVADARGTTLTRFDRIARFLDPGDLVVVNTSGTLTAALDGELAGRPVGVHVCPVPPEATRPLARPVPATPRTEGTGVPVTEVPVTRASVTGVPVTGVPVTGVPTLAAAGSPDWAVELRRPDRSGPDRTARSGQRVVLPGGVTARLRHGFPDPTVRAGSRLWRVDWSFPAGPGAAADVPGLLRAAGRPITYSYLRTRPSAAAYRTVFADEPGSAEAPSAGRPFSGAVLAGLLARGVALAPVVLHAGVSSPEAGEPPLPERFRVPASTARRVNQTRAAGGRVVAVGTTVVRALESAARGTEVVAASGWTDLVLGPHRPVRVVDGLVTGWHEPQASHLLLLEAVAGPDLVGRAYATALAERLLWHEFGDACLLLPRRTLYARSA